ncbi:hypothetical protein [Salinibacillus xinjiangensis]|uniref:Uncharacterized protein n=1 Tax=Salinibacillus xinjiangensis TaxID=1229268 RepID=A0A6G1X7T3_9BACI|nr:hypothetical protein [Salinibacillus xinjiangensis]MRG86989.1 hypothetical protein [Salinibacillus xinjiangensis]
MNSIPISIERCNSINCISLETWLTIGGTILGTLIGTLIAGVITLKTLKKQIEYNHDLERKKELENFLKVFSDIGVTINRSIQDLGSMIERLEKCNEDDFVKEYSKIGHSLEPFMNIIDTINYFDIPVNLYARISGIRFLFNNLIELTNKVEYSKNKKLDHEEKKLFEEQQEKILTKLKGFKKDANDFYEQLVEHDREAVQELKLIQKKWKKKI